MTPCCANDLVTNLITQGRPDSQFKANLEQKAKLKVATARVACELSDAQAAQLQQVALGDVNRTMQEVASLRHATEGLSIANREDLIKAQQMTRPLATRIQAGLHGKGSLFAKYLEHTLDESQKKRLQGFLAEKARERRHLLALDTVAAIEQRVPLLKAQREKLVELIDQQPMPELNGDIAIYSGYVRLAAVSEGQLNAFLDAEQTEFITRIAEPYKRWAVQ
jgi:hypothetical protein